MEYHFAKLHGAGNDFVMIEDMNDALDLSTAQVRDICDRHFGVGADGVIVAKPSPRSECAAYMDYYNSDGSKAQMCGNGVRCFAKFLVDNEIVKTDAGSLVADTLAGPKPILFDCDSSGGFAATVDMGEPIFTPELIPTSLSPSRTPFGEAVVDARLESCGGIVITCVSMGNPHAVVFLEDGDEFPIETLGPHIEVASAFPEKTNVEFAKVRKGEIEMRVWERGCKETLACGTGACATAVAAHLTGRAGRQVHVVLLGGVLDIEWRGDNHVYMTGPAEQSFTGTLVL